MEGDLRQWRENRKLGRPIHYPDLYPDLVMNVLLAYDGSDCAKAALADLSNIGLPPASHIHVLSVGELSIALSGSLGMGMGEFTQGSDSLTATITRSLQSAEQLAAEAKQAIETLLPTLKVTTDAVLGNPSHDVIERVKHLKTDLIVLGSHGRGLLSRTVLGSVSLRVLHAAPCSLRIVKRHTESQPLRIMLAVDGSTDSDRMLDAILTRVWSEPPEITLINVDDLTLMISIHGVGFEIVNEELGKQSHAILQNAQERLRKGGLRAKTLSIIGNPVNSIIEQAERNDISAIYLGAQGHGTIERIFLGSVSHGVASRFIGAVEVIR